MILKVQNFYKDMKHVSKKHKCKTHHVGCVWSD